MSRLAVFGASGHGKVVADTAECCCWTSIDFYDDAWPSISENGIWGVLGNTDVLISRLEEYDGVVVAIGSNESRKQKQDFLGRHGATFPPIIHPSAYVSKHAQIGEGSVVFANAVVNAGSILGRGCIVNTGAIIDHDCLLADFVHVSPRAALAGGVKVGSGAWVGVGASVRQLLHIGDWVTVGLGAAVVRDLDEGTFVGNPARKIN